MRFCGPKARVFLIVYTFFARIARFLRKDPPISAIPTRILLCCFGSLGDVVLATSLLCYLRNTFPKSHIAFLCEPNSISALEGVMVDKVYTAPNWMHGSLLRSLMHFFLYSFFDYPRIARSLRSYDLAIDCHLFFPNALPILRKARIPQRIAFQESPFSIWATDSISLPCHLTYLPDMYPHLLACYATTAPTTPSLSHKDYLVLHIGTSDPRKQWAIASWKELIVYLRKLSYTLIFTGRGHDEASMLNLLEVPQEERCFSSFTTFKTTIEQARALISVDSVSVHLGALTHTPTVALYLYNETLDLWLPNRSYMRFIVKNRCCYQHSHPLATYVDEISVDVVIQAFNDLCP